MKRIRLTVLAVAAVACNALSRTPSNWTEPATGMVFVEIPAGRLVMGSPADEAQREPQEIQHEVTITRSFWMGKFEVTQQQWQTVMGAHPSWFRENAGDSPVERVSWYDVHDFLTRLTTRAPGNRFRLPTEAEWEYACRSGTTTPFNVGWELTREHANIGDRSTRAANRKGQTMRVGSFPPNAWGLRDMHGNVWEWIEDDHCPYEAGRVTDPLARCGSALKVIRGGSWMLVLASVFASSVNS